MTNVAFIIGSPRSGTTLLGDVLDLHPQIGRWYEPYFVLDRYFRDTSNDCRTAADADDEVKTYIVAAFDYYQRKRRCSIVVDKSPRNSLKIPFLRQIFPEAKFIHILRDGRDATLSINREWQKRENLLITNNRNFWQIMSTVKTFLTRQPLLAHKIAAVQFEMGGITAPLTGRGLLHRLRWDGKVGWGPQFAGWQSVITEVSTLEFNALQWLKCVEAVMSERRGLNDNLYLEVRYEEFLKRPQKILQKIFDFLEMPFPIDFMSLIPALKTNNFGKWKDAFSEEEKALIGSVFYPLLKQLGYVDSDSWYIRQRNL